MCAFAHDVSLCAPAALDCAAVLLLTVILFARSAHGCVAVAVAVVVAVVEV